MTYFFRLLCTSM